MLWSFPITELQQSHTKPNDDIALTGRKRSSGLAADSVDDSEIGQELYLRYKIQVGHSQKVKINVFSGLCVKSVLSCVAVNFPR